MCVGERSTEMKSRELDQGGRNCSQKEIAYKRWLQVKTTEAKEENVKIERACRS